MDADDDGDVTYFFIDDADLIGEVYEEPAVAAFLKLGKGEYAGQVILDALLLL